MAFGTITSTSNTFGSVDGTATGVVPGTLSGSIGVPGPAGPTGPTGPQGPAGEGVPAGGEAGQYLQKTSGDDYATDWVTLDVSDKRDLTDYDFTNVADVKLETFGLTLEPVSGTSYVYDSLIDVQKLRLSRDSTDGGTAVGDRYYLQLNNDKIISKVQVLADNGSGLEDVYNKGYQLSWITGLSFINWDGTTQASTMLYGPTSITFPNASVQTIAFPGFANAALTGNPTAPTAALGDNDTSIATTAFVQQELLSGTANARNLEVQVRNQSGSTMAAGTIVYVSGATGNLPLITKAQANNDANSAQTIGFVKTSIANNGTGYVIVRGVLENIDTSALTEGVQLYLSPSTAGTWTTTKPSAPEHLVYVGVVIRSHPTLGTILVSVQNGYELHELHDVALSSEANNDLLVYELSTDLWKNKSFATLGLATLASPAFTGTPTAPTAAAATNTTQIATTAFVQQEVPAASTTAAGKVELATNAEAITSNSATLVPALDDLPAIITRPENRSINYINATAVSGSGAVAPNTFGVREIFLNSLAAGRAAFWLGVPGFNQTSCLMSRANNQLIDFSKKIWMSGKACAGFQIATNYMGDANTMIRVTLGGYNTNTTGDMTGKGFGWKKVGGTSPFFTLTVHNGTTLTDVATSVQQSDKKVIDWVIYSDGTGNVTLYIDGVEAATTNAGPTGNSTAGWSMYREQVEATATPTVRAILHSTGGHIYTEG